MDEIKSVRKEQPQDVKKLPAVDKLMKLPRLSEAEAQIMEEIGDNIRAEGDVNHRTKFSYTYRGQQFESGVDEKDNPYLSMGGRKILGSHPDVPKSMLSGTDQLANAHARDIYNRLHVFELIARMKRDPPNVAESFIKGIVGETWNAGVGHIDSTIDRT